MANVGFDYIRKLNEELKAAFSSFEEKLNKWNDFIDPDNLTNDHLYSNAKEETAPVHTLFDNLKDAFASINEKYSTLQNISHSRAWQNHEGRFNECCNSFTAIQDREYPAYMNA